MFSTLRLPVGLVASMLCLAVACKKEAPPPAPPPPPPAAPAPAPAVAPPAAKVEVEVTEAGFLPARIPAKTGQPLTLAITRKTDRTCAREILFAGQEGKTELPLNKTVEVTYTPKASGEVKFGCAMGMMVAGVLAVAD
ncbi:MAG TPA: cupredoxin domain-containing protein [Polyangia bacterium]|nr:cupredoxin domain-containing protein [Polyangia bacterium]